MKEDIKYLQHILDNINNIEHFIGGITKIEFLDNIEKQYAVIRGIEIIGEAVKNLSTLIKKECPNIIWRDIAGTRDVLIHSYFSVDLELVWEIIKNDCPKLKEVIKILLKQEKSIKN